MTPTADPTPLHIIMESAGNSDGISAGMAALIAAGISALIALLSASITQWFSNKRHEAELAERKADRLFDARREVASRCLVAIQEYVLSASSHETQIEASDHLRNLLTRNSGELAVLFSPELYDVILKINTSLLVARAIQILDEIGDDSPPETSPQNDDELPLNSQEHLDRLPGLFKELTEAFRRELGTYEEQPAAEKDS